MSQPVSECLIYKACRDEEAYRILIQKMRINLKHGGFTMSECAHTPPCKPPTPEEIRKLDARAVAELRKKPGS